MKKILILIISVFLVQSAFANAPKTEKICIKTSGTCDMCKVKIESALQKLDGVKSAYFNLANSTVKVNFDPSTINAAKLRECITMTGYDADELKANQQAYDALPGCCKKGSVCTDHKK